jgi:HK97 family phage prohead protease
MNLDAYIGAVERGDSVSDAGRVYRSYTATTEPVASTDGAADSRRLRFTISTESTDRDRDQIAVDGWRLDNYRKNPVVLWAHSYHDLPVARAVNIEVTGGKLTAEAEFVSADVSPFAETVYQMVKRGFLSATSVGFVPVKWVRNEERAGYDVMEAELLEFSIVPVPSNPEALIEARSAGLDTTPIEVWAKQTLAATLGPGAWLKAELAEAVLKIADATEAIAKARGTDKPIVSQDVQDGSESTPADKAVDTQDDGQQAATDILDTLMTKRGRVLSAANESKLRQAVTMLAAVLSQVEAEPVVEDDKALDTASQTDAEQQATTDPPLVDSVEIDDKAVVVLADPVDPTLTMTRSGKFDAICTMSAQDLADIKTAIDTRVRNAMVPFVMAVTGRLPD